MTDIKISVIIPVYNVEKYLCECVDSVLNQTYRNIEVILVDDGSTDNSPKLCDQYSKRDNRVMVIHKKNGGLSSARNAGMKTMTGEYFVFLDSDDYWNSNRFLKDAVINYLEFKNTDVVIFGYAKYFEDTGEKIDYIDFSREFSGENKLEQIKSLIESDMFQSSSCNKIIKTSIYESNDLTFREGIFSEDIDWNARLLIYADSFDVMKRTVYMYRQNSQSITHTKNKKYITDLKNNILRILELSQKILDEPYYIYYMNYCSYQYITFLNCLCNIDKNENVTEEKTEMKKYTWLLNYHINRKTKIVYRFNKIFSYYGMLKILKIYLKLRG